MKNMEISTADGVATEIAKPTAFEGLKDKASEFVSEKFGDLKNKAKEFALEKFADLKDRAGAFAKENWSKISGKTTEWISDIGEDIKLKIGERWKMERGEVSENKNIKHKEQDIEREKKKVETIDGKLTKEEVGKKKVEADFANLMQGAEDNPTLKAIIEKGKVEQVGKNDGRIDALKTEKDTRVKKQETFKAEIEDYKKNLEKIEANFGGKVDGRIDKIKTRDNYENNILRKETAEGSIVRLGERISKTEKELSQYEKVWEQRKVLGREAKRELRDRMETLKDFLNNSEKHLERAKELKIKYEKKIAKTEKRVSSLQEFKDKFVGKKEVASPEKKSAEGAGEAVDEKPSETIASAVSGESLGVEESESDISNVDEDEDLEDERTKENIRKTELIGNAKNFVELYKVLDEIGEVQGTVSKYTPDQLKEIIDRARNNKLGDILILTDTFGIRTKVIELLKGKENK